MKAKTRLSMCLLVLLTLAAPLAEDTAGQRGGRGGRGGRGAAPEEPRGLRTNTDRALQGYTLFAPLTSDTTYLIDMEGQVVRTWTSDVSPSGGIYIRENGNVLRTGRETETSGFGGGGAGGRLQEFGFDGELLWSYSLNTEQYLPHHDVAPMPNGNVLVIAWELKTPEEARAAGRREGLVPERGLWSDVLLELEPLPPDGARIVWEWRAWDHLIQTEDAEAPNYGVPGEWPRRIDLNADDLAMSGNTPNNPSSDLFHTNSVFYNEDLDQIVMSVPHFNEIWIIDHAATTEEARGEAGDLLYRWGNPEAYGRGVEADQRLGFEHDARWIPAGFPGAGNIMVFSNRTPGENGAFTRVYEITPPLEDNGAYTLENDRAFGPAEPVWTYQAPETFNATYISGARRLGNGNTLISSGPQGRLFEVDPQGEIVWEYWSPYSGELGSGAGAGNPFSIFRAVRIPTDHPALAGRVLTPLDPQPAVE